MSGAPRSHLVPVFQALFVTFLWSTSWILIKFGLDDIPALAELIVERFLKATIDDVE